MQDLTGQYPASLAPTSQEGGNLTSPDTYKAAAMTAPGSPPVTPMPALDEQSQMPQPHLPATQMPVSNAPGKPRVGPPQAGQAGRWAGAPQTSGFWKEVP